MPLSWVEIDLGALRHNFYQARERTAPNTAMAGVVKSDAYGHGMVPVARELAACGAKFLAVSKFWEALDLQTAGVSLPVITLLGVEPVEMKEAVARGIRPVVFRLDHARLLSKAALELNMEARIHVKVDTGMGRLGVPWDRASAFFDELFSLPNVRVEGVLSHFAAADEADKAFADRQLVRFDEVLNMISARGCEGCYAHISNSAGILDLPHAHYQLVRPGIMLYGSSPSPDRLRPADLRPVMSFRSKVIQLKEVPPGQPIGYGMTFVTGRPTRVATIPVGYDDGYPRVLSNRGRVLIRGRRAPVVGRVSMNMITADVTNIPEAEEDDEVVLLGEQGGERITGEEIADLCDTISYEIYCKIGRHRHKFFLGATDSSTDSSLEGMALARPAAL